MVYYTVAAFIYHNQSQDTFINLNQWGGFKLHKKNNMVKLGYKQKKMEGQIYKLL